MFTQSEGYHRLEGQDVYLIPDLISMRPFLMSLVSDCDLWMYLSSHGGLTAGRCSEDRAIFPYETDDKLHLTPAHAGPVTLMRIKGDGIAGTAEWAPFADSPPLGTRRWLAKSLMSSRITFEEAHPELPLTFRYSWCATREFGFVRSCQLTNNGKTAVDVEMIDGVLNILPAGTVLGLQQGTSCLINAYSQSEVQPGTTLATFALSSLIVDKAEPAEALIANTAFSVGFPGQPITMLSTDQLSLFRRHAGTALKAESVLTGRRGNHLTGTTFKLAAGQTLRWYTVIDSSRDQAQVVALRAMLRGGAAVADRLEAAMKATDHGLRLLLASADSVQVTADRAATAHHTANTLFNTMRGGALAFNGDIPADDFRLFLRQRNPQVSARHQERLSALKGVIQAHELLTMADATGDADLYRLASEYLPMHFGRRHGDPSRPWNRFAIRTTSATGEPIFDYQGNWRDIFQNWEALGYAFPTHLHTFISRFLNASTADGFNPYRVTRDGLDWESPDPHDPWANIGYWGDHQIIYLLKLLEAEEKFHPGHLQSLMNKAAFSYANVPYRIKPYADLLKNHRDTIEFDFELNRQIAARGQKLGADAKLLHTTDGKIVHATLAEKLLVPALSKLSNLVVGGGIWMNTQRPEWNDANNALVGIGISMVTLCYLRRYVSFLETLLGGVNGTTLTMSADVAEFLSGLYRAFSAHDRLLTGKVTDTDRKAMLDAVAAPFDRYRTAVYEGGFRPTVNAMTSDVLAFLSIARQFVEASIRENRRSDGLFHSYNLFKLNADGHSLSVGRLPEMLEGQVAVLSSGLLTPKEAADLIEALFRSSLFRADQKSFLLYPERPISPFLGKNTIPPEAVKASPLLTALLAGGEASVVLKDADGAYRFSPSFRKGEHLSDALRALKGDARYTALIASHSTALLDLYESIFHHSSFTGRSGSMFGYEGNGCIYWHMVAKLMLAAQECYEQSASSSDTATTARLKSLYYRIRGGLGFQKLAAEYGAFPPDAYSHTPKHAGAQQPGMTGQVKEELLTRLGELGISVRGGGLTFSPNLLHAGEVCREATTFDYVGLDGHDATLPLPPMSLAFTFCQTPIIYAFGGKPGLTVDFADGTTKVLTSQQLPADIAETIFQRRGKVKSVRLMFAAMPA